ncbi:MAG: cytochrome c [Bacteroidota bacterium]
MIRYLSISVLILCIVFGASFSENDRNISSEEPSVVDILEAKGVDYSHKRPDLTIKGVSVEVGYSLFHNGFSAKPNGGKSSKQSKHFVCTSCHNVEKEDPDLNSADPQARLEYTHKRGLPFLQGSTMYGAVNRATYYNGDYEKKYGDLVYEARQDIRNAIQLCATECAQGRALKDWEMESILAYLWTLEYKLDDIGLNQESAEKMGVEGIQAKYLQGSPATFVPPPDDRKKGTGLVGNAENGKLVYDNSCLHCHYQGRYSFFHLDDSKMSLKHLKRTMPKYSRHSIYQVIRWGVPSKSGKPSYMPQYTAEKLSDQQLADLRAYIEMGS